MRIAVIGAIIWAVLAGPAAAGPAAAEIVDRVPAAGKQVALTLEDIDNAAEFGTVLNLCKHLGIKVTFFIRGEAMAGLPVKAAADAGHEFGNHGMRRGYWAGLTDEAVAAELAAGAKAVQAAGGAAPRVVRPPQNYYGDNFRRAAAKLTPPAVVVKGLDTGDWFAASASAVAEQLRGAVAGGEIINISMKIKEAADALPEVVRDLKARGFELVTASELLKKRPAVAPMPPKRPPVPPDGAVTVVRRGEGGRPYVALTFDDGGPAWRVNEILDVLREAGVRSTFFLLGEWAAANPDAARRIAAEGHEIANHSYSHPRFTWLDAGAMEEEIVAARAAFKEAAGHGEARFFRPPYGAYDGTLTAVLKGLGYRALVMWDVDSRDWSGLSAEAIAARVLDAVSPGSIVLFHLHGANTAEALREIIPALRARGYGFTTVGELLRAGGG
jgi:peptidoglycan/xylan/chitin deacetylase (PgdA/CDA1 family)